MKLGDILISHGAIDQEKLDAALSDQKAFGGRLGRTLVDLGYLTEERLVAALAEQLGLTTIDLDNISPDAEALASLAVDACERYGVFPVKLDRDARVLWLATAEPERNNLQEVAQIAQLTLEPMLAPMSAIDRAVRRHYYGERGRGRQKLGEPIYGIPLDPGQSTPKMRAPDPRLAAVPAPPPAAYPPAGNPPPPANASPPRADTPPPPAQSADTNAEPPLFSIAPAGPRVQDPITELRELVVRLERAVSAQGRAFRSLVELLQEKGVVRRGELGARASKKPGI